MTAEKIRGQATWKSGNRELAVSVLSGPDAIGTVEVEFAWSGQRQRVRRSSLYELDAAAELLMHTGTRFVAVASRDVLQRPVQIRSSPLPAAKNPKPLPLPGKRIDSLVAAHIFPTAVRTLPKNIRLRLVGNADGDVMLAAYDAAQTLISAWRYDYNEAEATSPRVASKVMDKRGSPTIYAGRPESYVHPKKKDVTLSESQRLQQANGRKYILAAIHPDLNVEMRSICVGRDTAIRLTDIQNARAMILAARADGSPVPEPFIMGLRSKSGYFFLVAIRSRNGKRSYYAMLEPGELAQEDFPGVTWESSITDTE